MCRKCNSGVETLAHILGQCTHTKPQRIRHDIRNFVAEKITTTQSEVTVIEEESFETRAGTVKPDLIITDKERVHVVDVTVRHEDVGYLQAEFRDKKNKYSPLLPLLAEKFNTNQGKVLAIVVGSRRTIPKCTITSLKELQIHDRKTYISIALLALRSSIVIQRLFRL
jgi:hypothetical protein